MTNIVNNKFVNNIFLIIFIFQQVTTDEKYQYINLVQGLGFRWNARFSKNHLSMFDYAQLGLDLILFYIKF